MPMSQCIDLKPNVVNEVGAGKYCHLFHPEIVITSKEDAALYSN